MIDKSTIAYKLKLIRLELGMQQNGLAEIMEVGQSTISKYEKGEGQPRFSELKNLVTKLNVSPEFLLGNNKGNIDNFSVMEFELEEFFV